MGQRGEKAPRQIGFSKVEMRKKSQRDVLHKRILAKEWGDRLDFIREGFVGCAGYTECNSRSGLLHMSIFFSGNCGGALAYVTVYSDVQTFELSFF